MKLTKEQELVIIDVVEEIGIEDLALAITSATCNANMLEVEVTHRKALFSLIHSLQLASQVSPVLSSENV
jgi:hypothetical protein